MAGYNFSMMNTLQTHTYGVPCVGNLEPADDLCTLNGFLFAASSDTFKFTFTILTNFYFFRYHSTHDPDALISLDEYISRMKDDQDTILYLPGDSKEAILKSPILKKYVKRGYEVLLMHDPIDEFTTQHLTEYEKRKVKSIAKDDVQLIDSNDEIAKKKLQKLKEMYKPLTDWWKKFLGKDIEKVTVSNKLDDDPLFILTSQYGFSATMEKVNRAQAFQNQDKASSYMLAKKTLEINPHHSVMK